VRRASGGRFETVTPSWEGWDAAHLAHGFRVVGVRERIGLLDGVWCDVVLLERRSRVVGL
jgi:phosphinothricin acetyltransferase